MRAVTASLGPLAGNAMAYAIYGGLLLACSIVYAVFLRLPRDEMMAARRELSKALKRDGISGATYRGYSPRSMSLCTRHCGRDCRSL